MAQLPSHVVSEINAVVTDIVKRNTHEPTGDHEKQTVIDAVVSGLRRVRDAHGDDGEMFFMVTLAVLAGGGFKIAAHKIGCDPAALVDQLATEVEATMIDWREFPQG